MLIHVKLGVPDGYHVELDQIRATFPYGRLLPVEITTGGLTYGSGRRARFANGMRVGFPVSSFQSICVLAQGRE